MKRKVTILVFDKAVELIIYPLFLVKRSCFDKLFAHARSIIIKKYIESLGGQVGKDFRIGKNSDLRIATGSKMKIGNNVYIADNVMINCRKSAILEIGDHVHIQTGGRISAFECIRIGNGTLIASYSNILDHDHVFDLRSNPSTSEYMSRPINIGKGVWLGTKVQINKGTTVGDYSVVGANAVVAKNLDGGSVYVGIPAKPITK